MKEHQTAVVDIRTLSHEGRGVASHQNKTVFVENALPKERVLVQWLKKSRRFDVGKAIEILTVSEDRVEPKCAHFLECGGCVLQHMDPEKQIIAKQNILLEHLTHFGKVVPERVDPPLKGPIYSYRQKARLGVRFVRQKEKVLVGFREKESNKIADLLRCDILHPSVGEKITELKNLIQSLVAFDSIPQIEVAVADNESALIIRHLVDLCESDQEKLCEFAKKNAFTLFLQPKGKDSIHVLWPKEHSGLLRYQHPEYSIYYDFKPDDFIQVNNVINQKMVKKAIEWLALEPRDNILDFFCGLGNFTLPLARFAKTVMGIEGSVDMVNRAVHNAKLNGIHNATFMATNLEQPLDYQKVARESGMEISHFNKVLLDPPRTGAYTLVQALSTLKNIKTIVYVSCNPATLARDLGMLVHQGTFRLKAVQVMDMFPHTSHVESIALLESNTDK